MLLGYLFSRIFIIITSFRLIYSKELFLKRRGRYLNREYFIQQITVQKSETECLGACMHTNGCQSFNVFYEHPIICQLFPNVSNELTLNGNAAYFFNDYYKKKQGSHPINQNDEYQPDAVLSNGPYSDAETSDRPTILSTTSVDPNSKITNNQEATIKYVTSTNKPTTEIKSATQITSPAEKISTSEITSLAEEISTSEITSLPVKISTSEITSLAEKISTAEITSQTEANLPAEVTSPAEITSPAETVSPAGLSSSTETTINLPDPQVNKTEEMLPNTTFNIKDDSSNCFFYPGTGTKFQLQSCLATKQFKLQLDYTVTKYDDTACFVYIQGSGDSYQFVPKNGATLCLKFHITRVAGNTNWQMILLDESDQKTTSCLKNHINVVKGRCSNEDTFLVLD